MIKPDPQRISPILNFPTPADEKALDRFLGMTNYYRNFVPNFAEVARPLYEMKRTGKMEWTDSIMKCLKK